MKICCGLPLAVAITLHSAGQVAAQSGTRPVLIAKPGREGARWVEATLRGLSLERRIAQLITVDATGGYLAAGDVRMARWQMLARDHGVGSFVFYGGTPRDVAQTINALQKVAEIPLLMTADFEGGPGQQFVGATEYPGNMAFAAIGSEELMYRVASANAVEGRAMGIHLTYSPAVDIGWHEDNPAESVRSFGGDLDLLGRMVRAYVKGYHDNGMLTGAKHFPGRGDVERMPNNPDWTWNPKPVDSVRAQEFVAFKHAIDAGVDYVMTEHVAVPSATGGSDLPASVEGKLATGWLRDSLGFKGILTSDDLWYDHVIRRFGAEEVAVRAFEAGHDIILKPKDPVATIQALAAAVRSGRISAARVDGAVRKLLTAKVRLGLERNRFVSVDRVAASVGTPAHLALAQEVADRSLTMLKNDGVLPLSLDLRSTIVNINVQKGEVDAGPPALSAKLAAAFPKAQSFTLAPRMDPAFGEEVIRAASTADLVVVSFFVQRNRLGDAAPVRETDLTIIRRVVAARPGRVVAMSFGNPQVIRRIPEVPAFLVGYGERGWFGNQEIYFESLIRALKGELKPMGRLPVRVDSTYPIGSGITHER